MIRVNVKNFYNVFLFKKNVLVKYVRLIANYHNIKNMTINIKISSQKEMKKINSFYRKKGMVTNVLSFSFKETTKIKNRESVVIFLGDIIICSDVMKYESIKQRKIMSNHLHHLLVHSILHLLGYDHVCNTSKKKMEIIEAMLLMKMKIPVPYII